MQAESTEPTVAKDGLLLREKIQPWKNVKPKTPNKGLETVRHEFGEGEMLLDFGSRGCSYPFGSK